MVHIINIYPKYIKQKLKDMGANKIYTAKLYKTRNEHEIIREKWFYNNEIIAFDTLPGIPTSLYIKSKNDYTINKIISELDIINSPKLNSYDIHYKYYYGINKQLSNITFDNVYNLLTSKNIKNKHIFKNTLKLQQKKYYQVIKNDIIINYTSNVSEPWFTYIKSGQKTIEGRLNKGTFKLMQINDIVKWVNNNNYILTKIIDIKKYKSFNEYLTSEILHNCLPGIKNINDGINIYHKYYSVEDENKYGVLAIHLQLI